MIPFIDEILELHSSGAIRTFELAAWIVKGLSESKLQSDFDALPYWLKESVRAEIAQYMNHREWRILGSNGMNIDYAPFADIVIENINLEAT